MRILLAVDGSRSSDQARDLVAALPFRDGGHLGIVSVVPSPLEPSATDDRDLRRLHQDALDGAAAEIRSVHPELLIEPVLLHGRPATAIVDEAADLPADLVVLGARGHSGWGRVLLGVVANEVVDHAPCPVLIARDERLGPIVFADDGSPSARNAETVLTDWPIFAGSPVTVLTVVEDGHPARHGPGDRPTPDATGRLRRAGLDATELLLEGDPAHRIVEAARERDAGLIVVGTRGRTGSRRLILGSVARSVLLHAPCSVLIVREPISVGRPPVDRRRVRRETIGAFG